MTLGDVNGDSILDIVTANAGSNNVSVLLGNGDGTFGAQVTFATGTFTVSVILGDVNGFQFNSTYWSSTENTSTLAVSLVFSTAGVVLENKSFSISVRAVRSF